MAWLPHCQCRTLTVAVLLSYQSIAGVPHYGGIVFASAGNAQCNPRRNAW
jgi:hypothetical protein